MEREVNTDRRSVVHTPTRDTSYPSKDHDYHFQYALYPITKGPGVWRPKILISNGLNCVVDITKDMKATEETEEAMRNDG
ncbi:hypothetical protein U1Q18_011606 [Sarracenia purpurea var. burkii]